MLTMGTRESILAGGCVYAVRPVEIAEDTLITISPQQLSTTLDGDTYVLELSKGMYFELNDVAGRVWELLREPTTIAEVSERIAAEYDVEPDECLDDLRAFGSTLADEGLIVTLPA